MFEWAAVQKVNVSLDLHKIVLAFPNKRNTFEFAESVALSHLNALTCYNLICLLSRIALGEQEVEDELFAPLNYALHNVE